MVERRGPREPPLPAPVGVHDVDLGVPARRLMKAIFRPSGDQARRRRAPGLDVSLRSPLPSAFMT